LPDILSQSEIDDLLGAIDAPEEPIAVAQKGVVKPYDFRTANRFPKEQIRTFNIIFQNFSQLFSNSLSSILRTAVDCELHSVEEYAFSEFLNALPTPVILTVIKTPPLAGTQLIKISPDVAYMFISRLFGGSMPGGSDMKQFTEIELALIERVLRGTAGVFDEAWERVLRVNMQIERLETSPQFAQVVPLTEAVAVLDFELRIGDETGNISICVPHTSIEPVSKQLSTRLWYSSTAQDIGVADARQSELIEGKLFHTPVPLIAFFDGTTATVADILNLQVGDVVRLEHKVNRPVTINIAHIPKFHAKIGTQKTRRALQIVDIIKEENANELFTGRI
jgi:flagellar motor switch protein FliM